MVFGEGILDIRLIWEKCHHKLTRLQQEAIWLICTYKWGVLRESQPNHAKPAKILIFNRQKAKENDGTPEYKVLNIIAFQTQNTMFQIIIVLKMSTKVLYPEAYAYSEVSKAESTDDQCPCDSHAPRTYKTNLIKFKTQMCKNYSEMGYCPYRSKCQFAHGPHELVQSAKNPKKAYRTRKCKSFWEQGTCRYGFRCQFLHNETELDKQKVFLQIASNLLCPTPSKGKSRLTSVLQSHRN